MDRRLQPGPGAGGGAALSESVADVGHIVERFFEHLSARDWPALKEVLAPDVERVGPLSDRITGRDHYVDFLAASVPADYGNDVHLVTYAADGRSAFARVTEHLGYPNEALHLEETYLFALRADGLVGRVEVFWQTPRASDDPGVS